MIRRLYEEYQAGLLRFCTSMTRNEKLAEDLVQETFLRAMLHVEILENMGVGQRKAWLYRVAKNLFVDTIRRTSPELPVETHFDAGSRMEELDVLEWQQLLESLPNLEGTLFYLRYLEGYTSQQLSALFQMPAGTVRYHLSLARKHLREALKMR